MEKLKVISKILLFGVIWILIWWVIFNGLDELLIKLPDVIFESKAKGNMRLGISGLGAFAGVYYIYMGYKSQKNKFWKSDYLIYYLEKKFNLLEKVTQEENNGNYGWWEIRVTLEEMLKRAGNNSDIVIRATRLE